MGSQSDSPLYVPLTEREQEILKLLAEDLSDREIADHLVVATTTVKWYNRQIFNKLGVENRKDAVTQAHKLGLLVNERPNGIISPPKLPVQTTPFVGRERELSEIDTLFKHPEVRLLTILAPGGMGKTRLALEVARQRLELDTQPVYFVPLQMLSDADHIISAITQHLGLPPAPRDVSPEQYLHHYLEKRSALIVLDNWEHLLEGASLLTHLLEACSRLRLVVTSREKLNLSAEVVYVLRPMQHPTWETPADVLTYDAVQLLIQAAKRVQIDFEVTSENVDEIALICRLTQGMPLGILLAISWLDSFSLGRIAAEIQKSADFLETELRDLPERQRSIRTVFESVWIRLKPVEQQVFMKLAVFSGGFTADAAESVAAATPRILQTLMNKAFVTRTQAVRYEIHELLRQYGEQRLEASGQKNEILDQHVLYFSRFMRAQDVELKGARQIEATEAIAADFDNIRQAWYTVIERDPITRIESFLPALNLFAIYRSRYRDVLNLLKHAEERMREQYADHSIFGRLSVVIGRGLERLGVYPDAETYLQQGLAIARRGQDQAGIAEAAKSLVWLQRSRQDHVEAHQLADESIGIFAQLGDDYGLAEALFFKAMLHLTDNQKEAFESCISQALAIQKRIGDLRGVVNSHELLAHSITDPDRIDEVEAYHRQKLAYCQKLGQPGGMAISLNNIGALAFQRGDITQAERYFGDALALLSVTGILGEFKDTAESNLAMVELALDRCGEAEQRIAKLHQEIVVRPHAYHYVVQGFARLCVNDIPGASALITEALSIVESHAPDMVCMTVLGKGFVIAGQGNMERGLELVSLALNNPYMPKGLAYSSIVQRHLNGIRLQLSKSRFDEIWELGGTLDILATLRRLQEAFPHETT